MRPPLDSFLPSFFLGGGGGGFIFHFADDGWIHVENQKKETIGMLRYVTRGFKGRTNNHRRRWSSLSN